MRGKGHLTLAVSHMHRITPAYAGKRRLRSSGDTRGWDHPRVCGEKLSKASNVTVKAGSPPRMRGKVCGIQPALVVGGITPAYAGKRHSQCATWRAWRDHPRVCGEKFLSKLLSFGILGSPPRMRGKGCNLARGVRPDGITPAYAGKRMPVFIVYESSQDHPRVCGEKSIWL